MSYGVHTSGPHTIRDVDVEHRDQNQSDNIEDNIKSGQRLKVANRDALHPISRNRQRSITHDEKRHQKVFPGLLLVSDTPNSPDHLSTALTPKVGVRAQEQRDRTPDPKCERIQVEQHRVQVQPRPAPRNNAISAGARETLLVHPDQEPHHLQLVDDIGIERRKGHIDQKLAEDETMQRRVAGPPPLDRECHVRTSTLGPVTS